MLTKHIQRLIVAFADFAEWQFGKITESPVGSCIFALLLGIVFTLLSLPA